MHLRLTLIPDSGRSGPTVNHWLGPPHRLQKLSSSAVSTSTGCPFEKVNARVPALWVALAGKNDSIAPCLEKISVHLHCQEWVLSLLH